MIIIFGWLKEKREMPHFIKCYCYNCSNVQGWVLKTETEWISFFAIKTIPFLIKRDVYCERCGDELAIANLKYLNIRNRPNMLTDFIENQQLGKKTERQRHYLIEKRKSLD